MGKKLIRALLVFICMIMLGVIIICSHEERFDNLMVSTKQYDDIVQSHILSDKNILEEISFNGEVLLLDKDNKTFYYSIIKGESDAYNPYVDIESSNHELKLSFCGKSITAESVANNEKVKIIVYDNEYYEEYYLICTTLPLMNIEYSGQLDSDTKSHMTMSLYDNRSDIADRNISSDGTVHLRGGTSSNYPKNAYRISLKSELNDGNVKNNNISLLGMREDDDWILYQAYNDQEKVRNVFSTNLWKYTCASDNSLGIDNGIEYKYIELFMNGEYWGLYALGYPVDEKQLDIDSDKGEQLYKKIDWDSEAENDLYEGGSVGGYTTNASGDDRWDLLKKYYITLSEEWDDSESMYDGIDIDNAIDISLFVNLIQGIDQVDTDDYMIFKNMYMSVKKSEGKDVVIYTPWDLDITWGNVWLVEYANFTNAYGMTADTNVVTAYGNLEALIDNNDENIWNLILEKYHYLRLDAWSWDNLSGMIDGYESDIYGSGAYRRDMERWPEGSYDDPDIGLDKFREYVKKCLDKLDEYYDRVEELASANNIYITRSAQYDNFLSKKFAYEIDRRKLLVDDSYVEFMNYVGIDISTIPEDAKYAIVDGAKKTIEFTETVEGDLNLFDFTNRFIMWSDILKNFKPSEWVELLEQTDYGVVVEILNHSIINNEKFTEYMEMLDVSEDDITNETDFIVIDLNSNVSVVNNGHNSGDRSNTVIGELSVFYNNEGGYGVYIDGHECIISDDIDFNENADLTVSVMDLLNGKSVFVVNFNLD